MKSFFKRYENIFYPLISVTLFVAVWSIYANIVNIEMILPKPAVTFNRFFTLFSEKSFWNAVGNTLWRTLYSFFISFTVALLLAVLGSIFRPIHKLAEPIITIIRATPTMSIILLAIIWLKSASSPMLIAFLIIFPMCYTAFYESIISVDKKLIELSTVYDVKKGDMVKDLYIPSITPTLFSIAKSAISLNIKVIIAGEVMAQTRNSMGNFMQISKIYLNTAELLAWSVMAVLISYILEALVDLIKRMVVRW